jgi:hypothetical protein
MAAVERFDHLGGLLTMDVHADTVWLVISEALHGHPQAHILETDDAVAIAHWLLAQARKLGDPRPEVDVAWAALENLAVQEEARNDRAARMMGDA